MPEPLETATRYYEAWTNRDLDLAMSLVSDDVLVRAPAGELRGKEALHGFLEPFTRILTGTTLLSAFGDDTTAVLVYDTTTVPVPSAPATERFIVADGLIIEELFVFDRQAFTEARNAGG